MKAAPHTLVHGLRFGWSFLRLAADLGRLENIFTLNHHLVKLRDERLSREVVLHYQGTEAGAEAIRTRRRLRLEPSALARLDASTLGGAYVAFMTRRGLSASSIPSLPVADDVDYVVAHLYETHDLWHVVTGFDTDPAGEAGLQSFYLAQQRAYLPLFVLSAILLNTAVFAYEEKERRVDAVVSGWTRGKRARALFGLDWAAQIERPLVDVRRELGLESEGWSLQ
jgi:ubiquinone biosynthesis protein COQ4